MKTYSFLFIAAILSSVFSSLSWSADLPDYPAPQKSSLQTYNPERVTVTVSPVAGINWSTTTQSAATQSANQAASFSQSSGLGYTLGVLLAYSPVAALDLETGVIFSHHKVNYSDAFPGQVGSASVTYNNFQFPVVVRYGFLPFLSAGAGLYYARSVGPLTLNSTIPGVSSSTTSFKTALTNSNDYGFVFNARATAPLAMGMSAFLDARYLLGLLNLNQDGNPNDNYDNRELQLLAGIGFGF